MKILKICLISSHGGHLYELIRATKNIPGNKYFVVHKTLQTQQVLAKQKRYFVIDPHLSKWKYLINTLQSLRHIIIEQPDVVISTGAGISIPTMIICKKILNAKLIFIESAACVTDISRTGKFIYKYTDLFLVQWPQLLKHYKNAIYVGLQ